MRSAVRCAALAVLGLVATSARAQAPAPEQASPAAEDTATLQAQLDAAEAKRRAAQEEADAAKEAAKHAEDQLNDARAGKLIKYGVTGGFAIVAQSRSPVRGTLGAAQRSFHLTTMPYLAIMPWYWMQSDMAATYCASSFIDADAAAAAAAAMERARRIMRVSLSLDDNDALEGKDKARKQVAREHLELAARAKWDPTRPPSCWPTRFGFFVGKPVSYTAAVYPNLSEEEELREIKPTATAGVVFIPNAYIAVLLGVTGARIIQPAVPETGAQPGRPELPLRFSSFTVGVGGNLDLVSAVFR
jgi:hypothetical protein